MRFVRSQHYAGRTAIRHSEAVTYPHASRVVGRLTRAVTSAPGFARGPYWHPTQSWLDRATLLSTLGIYKTAWEQQDAALILTTFHPDAVHHERVLREPIRGHVGIAAYWRERVVKGQARISFTLLQTYLDGSTDIAEWEVSLDDVVQQRRKHMREITVLEFMDGKVTALREYWASEVIAEL
jgi:ketosteroid isomerase-like protein